MKKVLLALVLLLQLTPAIAQKIEVEKKTNLISVDGTPSFFLMPRNRILFTADYTLENMQHRELAYLKAVQQPTYSPAAGSSTETFYVMTFSQSGNSCELHGFTSFSVIKSLARSIAAARLVQNNQVSREAERKFVVMYNGSFVQDPSDDRGRNDDRGRYDDGRNSRDDQYGNDRNRRNDDPRSGDRRNDRTDDGRGYDNNRDNNGRNDNEHDNNDQQGNVAPAPLNINIVNNKIYDGDELLGTFKKVAAAPKGQTAYTVYDAVNKKVAAVKHTNNTTEEWQITLADGKKVMIRYREDSPLVKLFQAMAEKGYL